MYFICCGLSLYGHCLHNTYHSQGPATMRARSVLFATFYLALQTILFFLHVASSRFDTLITYKTKFYTYQISQGVSSQKNYTPCSSFFQSTGWGVFFPWLMFESVAGSKWLHGVLVVHQSGGWGNKCAVRGHVIGMKGNETIHICGRGSSSKHHSGWL